MVPSAGGRLVIAIRHISYISMQRGLQASAAVVVRKDRETGGGTVVVRGVLKQGMAAARRISAVHPRRERDPIGAAEIYRRHSYVLVGSVSGDCGPNLAGDPANPV